MRDFPTDQNLRDRAILAIAEAAEIRAQTAAALELVRVAKGRRDAMRWSLDEGLRLAQAASGRRPGGP